MHQGVTYGKGQFKILATNQAIEILGACKIHATFFLLCVELTFTSEVAANFTRWQSPTLSDKMSLLHLDDAQKAQSAPYSRVECHGAIRDVWLLLG
jgi:hypothetical protein